jgi:hypothetical protein
VRAPRLPRVEGWCSFGTANWDETERTSTRIPDIPRVTQGRCPQCGATQPLLAHQIFYWNYHGPGNTGLPDYYVLRIARIEDLSQRAASRRWGMPYMDAGIDRIPISAVESHVRIHFPYDWNREHDPERWG